MALSLSKIEKDSDADVTFSFGASPPVAALPMAGPFVGVPAGTRAVSLEVSLEVALEVAALRTSAVGETRLSLRER